MITLNISRQFGSGGAYVGRRLARKLGFKYADREILTLAARRLDVPVEELSLKEEKAPGFWEDFFRSFTFGAPDTGFYTPPPLRTVSDESLLEAEADIIRNISGRYDAVIIGRAAFHVLAGSPGAVNVFLHAPLEFRVKRVMELYRLKTRSEAEAMIDRNDEARERFVRVVTGRDWMEADNFHLCVDTAAAGFDLAEEMIEGLVRKTKAGL